MVHPLIDKGITVKILKSPAISTLFMFVSANMVAAVVTGIGGIIQARWLPPETLGNFQQYAILTSYLAIGLVFVQDGLMRQFPYLMGRGEKNAALAIAATAKTWYLGVASVFSLIIAALSINALLHNDYVAFAGWLAQIVVAITGSYGIYQQTIYRRSMEFKRLSYNSLISSFVTLAGLLPVRLFGFYGLAIKSIAGNLTRIWFDAKYIPLKVKANWNKEVFYNLAKISIPLSLEGYIRTSFVTATFAFLVVKYCGKRDLGVYGIAAAFEGFAMIFVSSLMQMCDVRMTNRFGETESLRKSAKMLIAPILLGIVGAVVLGGALCLFIGPFIRFFVPNYADSIPVVYVLSLGLPIGVLMMPTRLLRVALMYKSVYAIAVSRLIVLLVSVQFVSQNIVCFAGCKMLAEFASVICGYVLLWRAMLQGGKNC